MKLKLWLLRLEVVWNVLFGKNRSFFVIWISKENIGKLLTGDDFKMESIRVNLQIYKNELRRCSRIC